MKSFIKQVKAREILWSSSGSTKRNVPSLKAWNEVARACNLKNGKTAIKQWDALCREYKKELKKFQAHLRSNSKFTYKPKMKYFHSLSFMMDHVQPKDETIISISSSEDEQPLSHIRIDKKILHNETPRSEYEPLQSNLSRNVASTRCLNTNSRASLITKRKKKTSRKKEQIDPHLDFFKSLIPYMKAFSPIEALKVRSDIQNIVHDHYRNKISNLNLGDYDTVSSSRCESESMAMPPHCNSAYLPAEIHTTYPSNNNDIPNGFYSVPRVNSRQYTNSEAGSTISFTESAATNHYIDATQTSNAFPTNVQFETVADVHCSAEKSHVKSPTRLHHLRQPDNITQNIKCEFDEEQEIVSDSAETVVDVNEIVPKDETCDAPEEIQKLLMNLPPSVTVECHSVVKKVSNEFSKANIVDSKNENEVEAIEYEDEVYDVVDHSDKSRDSYIDVESNDSCKSSHTTQSRCVAHEFSPVVFLTRLEDLIGLDNASITDLQSFYVF